MRKLVQEGGEKPTGCSLQQHDKFIRYAMNLRLQSLQDIVDGSQQYRAAQAQKPAQAQLYLTNLDQILQPQFLSHLQSNKDQSAQVSTFQQYGQIFRISRDLLTCTQKRKSRLLAGIQETLGKAWANSTAGDVYL